MILTETINYPAFTGDEERRLYVYLPTDYNVDPNKRYPVLYMFDGHNVFFDEDATYGKSWGLADYLDYTDTPLIVAAIECHQGPNDERLSEYSPYNLDSEHLGKVTGRGDQTIEVYTQALKPWVDDNFRTLPDREHTFIAGSSMGGLMSLYAVLKYNHIFSRCAALSPSIFPCYDELTQLIEGCSPDPDTTIYMDLGTEEMSLEGGSFEAFARFGGMLMERGIPVTQRIVSGGQHSEASWEKQLPIVINVLIYEN